MKKKPQKSAMTLDKLAIMVAKGFEGVDERFERVETRLSSLEEGQTKIEVRITNLEEGQKKINRDILDMGDKFVPRSEFDNLVIRFNRLDEKVRQRLLKK